MKKFLSIILAVMMVLALAAPLTAFAEEGDPFKIGETTYADLLSAINAANDGDTIVMTRDYSEDHGGTQNKFRINKAITIDGGDFTLDISSAANIFPFRIEAVDKTVTVKNFKAINFQGGGFDVATGTLVLDDVVAASKGRACIKAWNGTITVSNSELSTAPDASKTEAVCILYGNATLNLKDGAVLKKNQGANGSWTTQAAVLYTTGTGNITINMESGSKMVANHAEGEAKTSIIARNSDASTFTINMAQGAYLVSDSANITDLTFVYNIAGLEMNLNAYAGAFLVKEGLETTVGGFQESASKGGRLFQMVAMETSPVEGYVAYQTFYDDSNASFEFVNDSDQPQKANTLAAAIAAAKTGTVIKMIKDYSCDETGISLINKELVLDLNGLKFEGTGAGYLFGSMKGKLTIKKGTFEIYRGSVVQDGGHLTFEDVTATITPTGSSARPIIKLSGGGNAQATIINSTVATNGPGEALILIESGTAGVLNVVNSTLCYQGALKYNQNNACVSVQGDATNATINVDETSTLVQNANTELKGGAEYNHIASIVTTQSLLPVTLNLAKGATLKIQREAGETSSNAFISVLKEGGSAVVNDKGANFVLSADAAQKGIVLPDSLLGYKVGDVALKADENGVYTYVNAEAAEEVVINSIAIDIAMVTGASIRNALPFGLRFTATISEDVYNALLAIDPNAKLGFVLAKARKAGSAFNIENLLENDYVIVDAKNIASANGVTSFNTTVYVDENSCLITSDNASGFKTSISAKAFITLTIDGVETTYWVDFDAEDNSRSIYDVAKGYYEDTVNGSTNNEVVNYILDTCSYKFN